MFYFGYTHMMKQKMAKISVEMLDDWMQNGYNELSVTKIKQPIFLVYS